MFYALAIVCDDYFVPSLEKISEVREQRVLAGRQKVPSMTSGLVSSFRTCSSARMWPGPRSWLPEALLRSSSPLSLVSSSAALQELHRGGESQLSVCGPQIITHSLNHKLQTWRVWKLYLPWSQGNTKTQSKCRSSRSRLLSNPHSGVFITKGDVGVGTIVGSAVFNILVIIGLSGIFAGQVEENPSGTSVTCC